MKPIIIMCGFAVENRIHMPTAYIKSIESAGGLPLIVPPHLGNIDDVLSLAQGVFLAGGGDIDSKIYGGSGKLDRGVDKERDTYEIAIIRAALVQNKPIFGVCRGCQVLNVALGGTLLEDIPNHGDGVFHKTEISSGFVGECFGVGEAEINSYHHQACDVLGEGLHMTAVSGDGICEAIERAGESFCVGVQFHPERSADDVGCRRLFEMFVSAASSRISN